MKIVEIDLRSKYLQYGLMQYETGVPTDSWEEIQPVFNLFVDLVSDDVISIGVVRDALDNQ